MDPKTIGAAGSLLSGVTDLANLGLSLNAYGYQKRLQKKIFKREDTAVQRRVNDLKQAGLSPVLAAGSAAGSGGTVAVNAPQLGDMSDKLSMAYDLATQQKNIERTDADIERTKIDILKQMEEIKMIGDQRNYIKSQTNGQYLRNQKDAHDLKITLDTGLTSSNSGITGMLKDAFGGYNKLQDNLKNQRFDNQKKDRGVKDGESMTDFLKRAVKNQRGE